MAELQLYSFNLNEENIDNIYLSVFKLPQEVKEVIEALNDTKNKRDNIAGSTIFKIAAPLFEEVIYANKRIYDINKDDGIWFYSVGEFDLDILKVKVIEWLREEYKKRLEKDLNKRFIEEWHFDGKISLKEIIKRENTSKYNIISNYYVYRLSKNSFKFECLQKNLRFHRAIEDNNTILLTMPIKLENKFYTPFSYYIVCKMTKPIDIDDYALNFYLKVRVWTDYNLSNEEGHKYLDRKESTSIFIYKDNEYYTGEEILFNRVQIKGVNKDKFIVSDSCDDNYIKLSGINIDHILKNVKEHLEGSNGYKALITCKNIKNANTKYGAGLPERNEMLKNLVEMLPELDLRKSIKSISTRGNMKVDEVDSIGADIRPYYNLEEDIEKKTKINKERYMINHNIDKIVLNVYTDKKQLYDKVEKIFSMYLRLENNLIYDRISPDGYKVEIKMLNNDFTKEFVETESMLDRKLEIESVIPRSDKKILNLALIDIPAYHEEKETKNRDPKNIIRSVFKENEVLTQFINYDEKTNVNAIMNAVKDLIAAGGFVEYSLYKNTGVEKDDILVGLGKISGGSNEKILAMSKIDRGNIYINIYGINKWMRLDECIFTIDKAFIDKINISKNKNTTPKLIEQWVLDNLSRILEQKRKVYTFIDANTRNGLWAKIKNENFNDSMLSKLRLLNKDLLRMIRINDTEEVPEYFIYDGKENINKRCGVFKGNKNTYYLVGKRHNADNKVAASTTKCSYPDALLKRPSLYEINIVGCSDEKYKDKIAIMTQELRRMNISYDNHTSLPLPLYTTKRLSEYIIAEKNS